MKVGELIEELEGLDEDDEVRLASQPSYPFEYSIDCVTTVIPTAEDVAEEYNLADDDQAGIEAAPELKSAGGEPLSRVVYLAEGRQLGYLPGVVRRELGWR